MKNLILLYFQIWDFIAMEFIEKLNEYEGEETTIRINSPGGNVFAGWGMIAAVTEFTGTLKVKVDGVAASMAAYLVLFCENVECVDVSRFMLHPARGYVENDEDQALLDSVNAELKAKMKSKFDAELFKSVTGHTIDDMFKDNVDIWLTAKQAKKLGMVNKINRLDPSEKQAFTQLAACGRFEGEAKTPEGGQSKSVNWENISKNINI
jgi:ATP-dependent protease ClpP protease subunit